MFFRLLFLLISFLPVYAKAIECQDHRSICDDQSTCCRLDSGDYGCCPMPRAVCCTDGVHCCPETTACDLQTMQCVGGTIGGARVPLKLSSKKLFPETFPENISSVPWSRKLAARTDDDANREYSIICDDQKSKCPDEATCCKLSSGRWGCCPMPRAVCCSDGIHCCPENTICDLDQVRCVQSTTTDSDDPGPSIFLALTKISTSNLHLWSVTCDQKYKCPDWTTCCKLRTGRWGCCPMPRAVCCPDGVHCCPQDTSCDVEQGQCQRNDISGHYQNVFKKKNAMGQISLKAQRHALNDPKICPDHKQTCPVDQTCCLFNQSWSCCPLPEGVCCSDADPPYCCAKGQKCGSTSGQVCITP